MCGLEIPQILVQCYCIQWQKAGAEYTHVVWRRRDTENKGTSQIVLFWGRGTSQISNISGVYHISIPFNLFLFLKIQIPVIEIMFSF